MSLTSLPPEEAQVVLEAVVVPAAMGAVEINVEEVVLPAVRLYVKVMQRRY